MTKNILFKIFFFSGIAIICILFLPALLLPHKITLIGGKIMGHWTKFCLRIFLKFSIVFVERYSNPDLFK